MKQVKRSKPNISIEELVQHKKLATTILAGINLTATTDNKVIVEMIPTREMRERMERERSRAEAIEREARRAQVDVSQFQNDPAMADRYGTTSPNPNQNQSAPPPRQPQADENQGFQFAGEGSWNKLEEGSRLGAEKYQIRLQGQNGAAVAVDSVIKNQQLLMYTQGLTLVLNRIQY
jgi:hypothetical protein